MGSIRKCIKLGMEETEDMAPERHTKTTRKGLKEGESADPGERQETKEKLTHFIMNNVINK